MNDIDTGGAIGRGRGPKARCKLCQCSIFDKDDTVWVRAPTPGLAHAQCAAASAEETKETESR